MGENLVCQSFVRLEAFKNSPSDDETKLVIGNDVDINWFVHIGASNRIEIHDNVLIGSRVLITDHSHGEISQRNLNIPPNKRKIYSKGPVIIQKNVWIGEGACILPNVTIGQNSIIGANAVVTKSVPPNSVVVGVPAKVVKRL